MSYGAFISYSHAADGLLAPRLQAGLQRFAKPWWRRRAIRVFRDEASLSANPHLWSSITDALDQSEWFVLLLSPDAAESPWVNDEVAYWLANKPADRILPVVTDGEFGPDIFPPALTFDVEPRWVDLRFAKTDTHLDLNNPTFSTAVADIASAVRGIPKEDLESEEVRQHRRTMRTAWGAGIGLLALTIATAWAATTTAQSANLAQARTLTASAVNVIDDDPELTLLLSLEAIENVGARSAGFPEATIAMRSALESNRLIGRFVVAEGGWVYADLSADGSQLVVASDLERSVTMFNVQSGNVLWVTKFTDTNDLIASVAYGPGDSIIAVSFKDLAFPGTALAGEVDVDSEGNDAFGPRVLILDSVTAQVVQSIELGACPSSQAVSEHTFTPDGRWLQVYAGEANCGDTVESDWIDFYSTDDWSWDFRIDHGTRAIATFSDDMTRILIPAEMAPAELRSFPDDEVILSFESRPWGAISPDGASLVVANPFGSAGIAGLRPLLHNASTGDLVDILEIDNFLSSPLQFSPDGSMIFGGNRSDDILWDAVTGRELIRLRNESTVAASFSDDSSTLATSQLEPDAGTVLVWNIGPDPRGSSIELPDVQPWWINSDRIQEGQNAAGLTILALLPSDHPQRENTVSRILVIVDPATGDILNSIRASASTLLPDGRYIVARGQILPDGDVKYGPLVAWDPSTSRSSNVDPCVALQSELADEPPGCDGIGVFAGEMTTSTDGAQFAVSGWMEDGRTPIRIYDTTTLEVVRTINVELEIGEMLLFHNNRILIGTLGPTSGFISVIDVDSGAVVRKLADRPWRASRQLNQDGSLLYLGRLDGFISVVDTATWDEVDEWRAHDGNNRGLALSPSGRLLASTGEDDFVTIWDVNNGHLLIDKIPLPFPSDAIWIDEDTIGVALAINVEWAVIDLSQEALFAAARRSLTRTFSPEECMLYQIESCPDG